jgi:hypothetical protein
MTHAAVRKGFGRPDPFFARLGAFLLPPTAGDASKQEMGRNAGTFFRLLKFAKVSHFIRSWVI